MNAFTDEEHVIFLHTLSFLAWSITQRDDNNLKQDLLACFR